MDKIFEDWENFCGDLPEGTQPLIRLAVVQVPASQGDGDVHGIYDYHLPVVPGIDGAGMMRKLCEKWLNIIMEDLKEAGFLAKLVLH